MTKPEWGTDEYWRQHPIFDTDFTKSPDKLIEEIRCKLSNLRGQLGDIGHGYSGFRQQLDEAQGLLTCGISYLYHIREDMEKCFKPKKDNDLDEH